MSGSAAADLQGQFFKSAGGRVYPVCFNHFRLAICNSHNQPYEFWLPRFFKIGGGCFRRMVRVGMIMANNPFLRFPQSPEQVDLDLRVDLKSVFGGFVKDIRTDYDAGNDYTAVGVVFAYQHSTAFSGIGVLGFPGNEINLALRQENHGLAYGLV